MLKYCETSRKLIDLVYYYLALARFQMGGALSTLADVFISFYHLICLCNNLYVLSAAVG